MKPDKTHRHLVFWSVYATGKEVMEQSVLSMDPELSSLPVEFLRDAIEDATDLLLGGMREDFESCVVLMPGDVLYDALDQGRVQESPKLPNIELSRSASIQGEVRAVAPSGSTLH